MPEDNRLYCMYLRKSRKDMEAERAGVDTLARHEQILTACAKQNGYKIGKIYREVATGDTIAGRPEMQNLLSDIENHLWKGVLVTEVERLARGDTIDQGIVSQVFKFSGTLIVTPFKTYDPNNEYDEEFFEYGLFQSRREYKAIVRRQQNGAKQSIEEGKWPYNKAPYGYERYKLTDQKGWSLRIVPEQAKIVKQIFQWYSADKIGYTAIADMLNNMQIPAPATKWSGSTIKDILTNVVYTGRVKRGERGCVKHTAGGNLKVSRPRNSNYIVRKGLHEAIIDDELYKTVQTLFSTHPSKPVASALEIKNPLAGLVYCQMCGRKMIRRPQDRCKTMIICTTKGCKNISSYENVLETATLKSLNDYLESLRLEQPIHSHSSNPIYLLQDSISQIEKEIETLNSQLDNAYNLVEQGVYSPDIFMQRSKTINAKLSELDNKKEKLNTQIEKEQKLLSKSSYLIPKIENILNVYDTLQPPEKNALLTEIIESIDYIKTERSKQGGPYDNFHIELHPRVPV